MTVPLRMLCSEDSGTICRSFAFTSLEEAEMAEKRLRASLKDVWVEGVESVTVDEARRETIAKRLTNARAIVDECLVSAKSLETEDIMAIDKAYRELTMAIKEVRDGIHSA